MLGRGEGEALQETKVLGTWRQGALGLLGGLWAPPHLQHGASLQSPQAESGSLRQREASWPFQHLPSAVPPRAGLRLHSQLMPQRPRCLRIREPRTLITREHLGRGGSLMLMSSFCPMERRTLVLPPTPIPAPPLLITFQGGQTPSFIPLPSPSGRGRCWPWIRIRFRPRAVGVLTPRRTPTRSESLPSRFCRRAG